jgi:acetyltransferase-like isoleucine patch superfamily enzyme
MYGISLPETIQYNQAGVERALSGACLGGTSKVAWYSKINFPGRRVADKGYRGGLPKIDWTFRSIYRSMLIILVPYTALSIGLLPPLFLFLLAVRELDLSSPLHVVLLAFILVFLFILLIFTETLVPGLMIKLFRLKNKQGSYEVSIRDDSFFRFVLLNVIFQWPLKLFTPFRILILRRYIYRLAGLKLGRTSTLSGTEHIFDPSVTEIGEGTFIGGNAKIYGHMVEDKFIIKKVKIGDNCLIGADSSIMPGVVIEDNVTLGIQSLVTKDQVLKEGKTYAGTPAREISMKEVVIPPPV